MEQLLGLGVQLGDRPDRCGCPSCVGPVPVREQRRLVRLVLESVLDLLEAAVDRQRGVVTLVARLQLRLRDVVNVNLDQVLELGLDVVLGVAELLDGLICCTDQLLLVLVLQLQFLYLRLQFLQFLFAGLAVFRRLLLQFLFLCLALGLQFGDLARQGVDLRVLLLLFLQSLADLLLEHGHHVPVALQSLVMLRANGLVFLHLLLQLRQVALHLGELLVLCLDHLFFCFDQLLGSLDLFSARCYIFVLGFDLLILLLDGLVFR